MIDPSRLYLFMFAALALLLAPGPAVLYITARSASQGRTAGLVSVFASSLAGKLKGNQCFQTGGRYFAGLVYVGMGITTALMGARK
jgi:threonine/homoserine/homoserine lactone efflux protein